MFVILFLLILAGSYCIGTFAFPQIIGSLRYRRIRPVGLTVFTIMFWGIIVIAITISVHCILKDYLIAYYMGLVPTLLMTLGTKNIE